MKQYNTEPVKKALETAKSVLILLPQNPSLDSVAAGLSLYLALTKSQKSTSIGCPTEITVEFNRLFGVDKIKSRIGNQNLVVSFSYQEDSLEKVSYDKDPQNQKFHLTIEPKAGLEPLDANQVEFSYTGSNADLIFVIGARSLEDLGFMYQQEKTLLDNKEKTLVNLSTLDKNAQFGTVNLYDPTASGSSEIVLNILKALNLNLQQDIATNLLAGIESATNNLSSCNTPETYETIAELIRLGAKKGHLTPQMPRSFSSPPTSLTPPSSNLAPKLPISPSPKPTLSQTRLSPPSFPQPPRSPQPLQPPPTNPAMTSSSVPPPSPIQPSNQGVDQPKPEWLKPKVITSSGIKT